MSRRLAAVLAVAFLALAGAAALLLLRDGDEEDSALARMSVRERPFEMPIPNQLGRPGSPQTTGEAFLIAERNGVRIVRLPREDGSSCWGTTDRRLGDWQLTFFSCETTFGRFPDPENPVLVLSQATFFPGTQLRVYESFQGVAADGVARVGVVDERDRVLPVTRVQRNAFFAAEPTDRVTGVVALDAEGEVIWRSRPVEWPEE
jgi:hypothetical protein